MGACRAKREWSLLSLSRAVRNVHLDLRVHLVSSTYRSIRRTTLMATFSLRVCCLDCPACDAVQVLCPG